jgi:predicted alpha/beta-hydrolase family hydrolase
MATETTLSITGHRNDPVPNRFIRPRGAIDKLAMLLPGFGYTCDMPLFYYAENLLTELGWDILRVEYGYSSDPEFREAPDAERRRWLFADAEAVWRAGLAQRSYAEVALIGKSLGTRAMGHLLPADGAAKDMRAVWLTPLLSDAGLCDEIEQRGVPSLFVIGAADPEYDPTALDRLTKATGGAAMVVDGADHGLDIPGNPVASVHELERVMAAMTRFFNPGESPGA